VRPWPGSLLFYRSGGELCLTIVGTPLQAPLHEGMRFARATMSSASQYVLGCLPTDAFQVGVVGEMLAMFLERVERCSRLEDSGSRVCDLILRPDDDRV
jgi:hypothetical protein